MSLISLSKVGVSRDFGRAIKQRVCAPDKAIAAPQQGDAGGPTSDGTASTVAQFGQLLVAQIPSEALLAYTTLLAVFSAAGAHGYVPGRWILYVVSVLLCPVVVVTAYLGTRNYGFLPASTSTAAPASPAAKPHEPAASQERGSPAPARPIPPGPKQPLHLPILPAITATVSMAIYGLTVPGCALQSAVSGAGFAVCAGCLAVGGGVIMSLFAPFLGRPNSAEVDPASVPAQRVAGPRL